MTLDIAYWLRVAKLPVSYCACDYPLREVGRDVLTGEPVYECDQCHGADGDRDESPGAQPSLLEVDG